MTEAITVTLHGEPVAWARARLGARGIHFTPPKQRNNGAALRLAAREAMGTHLPFECPVRIDLTAEMAIPQSWSGKKQRLAETGEIMPGKKPDIDNLYKMAADAMNGIVFRDDALIVEASLRKVYSRQPKLTVTIEPALPTLPSEAREHAPDRVAETWP